MKLLSQKRCEKAARGPNYWIVAIGTMGMLIAYCPANSHHIVLGKAQTARRRRGPGPAANSLSIFPQARSNPS